MIFTSPAILGLLSATLCFGIWCILTFFDNFERTREFGFDTSVPEGSKTVVIFRRMERHLAVHTPVKQLANKLASAGVGWSPLLTILVVMASMLGVALAAQPLLGKIGALIMAVSSPFAFLQWLTRKGVKRREDFTVQLPEMARIIANGNAAGLSIARCLAMAGRELPDPAGAELSTVAKQLNLGWSVDQSLRELSERLPSRELDVLMRTIVIQARSGGALSSALSEISQTLEDRKELRREVRTVILGSAVSGYAVIAMGCGASVLMNLIQPGMLDQMAGSTVGRIIIAASMSFFGLGAVLMRVVSRVEV